MENLFLFCAIFGGTFLIVQFFLGFGGGEHGSEGPEDAPDDAGVMDADAGDHGDHHDEPVITIRPGCSAC